MIRERRSRLGYSIVFPTRLHRVGYQMKPWTPRYGLFASTEDAKRWLEDNPSDGAIIEAVPAGDRLLATWEHRR